MSPTAAKRAAAITAAVFLSAGLRSSFAAEPCGDPSSIRQIAESITALGPRPDSSPTAETAAQLITSRLVGFGLSPQREAIGEVVAPKIEVGPWQIRPTRVVNSTSENIWVRFGGDGPARLLMAHYDTVPGSPGAVDNATAVAILLELAGCFSRELPSGPVILAFTGGEENGLLGARRLAQNLKRNLELAVSLDLIGHQADLALNGLGPEWSSDRLAWLADRVEEADADASPPLFHRLISRRLPQLERSDHKPLAAIGVPALHLYGRDGERIYLAYHTPHDTMNRVRDDAIRNATALAHEIATAHDPLPPKNRVGGLWIPTPLGHFVLTGYIVLAIEIVLAIAAGLLLMLCWARRRRAIRERAVGGIGVFLIFVISFLVVALANYAQERISGNAFAFAHEPLRFTAASITLAIAVAGLLAILVNRRAFFIRGTRYHSLASFLTLIVGCALLGFGATELAWMPLLASALFALAGFLLNRPIWCTVITLLGVLVSLPPLLAPGFIREAIFHGFYPDQLPLAGYLALVSLPSWMAVVGAFRARFALPARGVTIALVLALLGAASVSVAVIVVPGPTCTSADSFRYGLACELPEIAERTK